MRRKQCGKPVLAALPVMCQHIVFVALTAAYGILEGPREQQTGESPKMSETELLLKGYGLTTAEFFYRMPDYRNVLNTFVWQDYDLAPDHPKLFAFIDYWKAEIEGPLHSVRFTHRNLVAPGEWRNVTGEFTVH